MIAEGQNAVRQRLRVSDTSEAEIELSWCALTDVGKCRDTNQDSYLTVPPVFAVADGMGGHAAGEVASAAVAGRLAELARVAETEGITAKRLEQALLLAVDDMLAESADAEQGTGTTVSGVAVGSDEDGPMWSVFNIGDSRVYQFFKGTLTQITVDHSVVQHLIDTGQISAAEAEFHPHSNVITRAVGMGEDPMPDYGKLACIPGQRLLVCTDGLTKELTDIGIQHFLATSETAEEAAMQLMQHALGNAGRDNVTVVVIDVHSVGDMRDTRDVALEADENLELHPGSDAQINPSDLPQAGAHEEKVENR